MRSSRAAVNLVVASEVGSRAQFEAKYHRPEWPGGQSGVTVGIGYDLGYQTREKIEQDWGRYLPKAMILAMQNVAGLKGEAARAALPGVRNKVSISFEQAMEVFEEVDFPRYEAMLLKYVPGAAKLPPDCFGALASIIYNRGAGGFTAQGDRFREMRIIRADVNSGNFKTVPAQIRSMKRLWQGKNLPGLISRRENEACLFEAGLQINKPLPDWLNKPKAPVTPAGKPRFDLRVETAQRALTNLGYHEVGDVDGSFGGKTRAAITAFMIDRGKDPQNGELTPEFEAEINAAITQKWTRPIKEERKNATAKDLAKKIPSIDQTWWQKLWAFILGIPSALAAVFKTIFGDQASIGDYVDPVKNFFASIPPELYFLAIAVIAVAVFIQAKRAQDATVKAYQQGQIN